MFSYFVYKARLNITGSIPTEIVYLSKLDDLFLGTNNLSGPLPTWIPQLKHLKNFSVPTNKFTGTIPPVYFHMEHLDVLNLASNSLSGSIPTEVGLFGGKDLTLIFNQFASSIPEEVYSAQSLEWLILNKNHVSELCITEHTTYIT